MVAKVATGPKDPTTKAETCIHDLWEMPDGDNAILCAPRGWEFIKRQLLSELDGRARGPGLTLLSRP